MAALDADTLEIVSKIGLAHIFGLFSAFCGDYTLLVNVCFLILWINRYHYEATKEGRRLDDVTYPPFALI